MAVRLPDWEPRLAAFLETQAATPFAFGRHDCALMVAGAVLAMTGEDFGAPFRGRYTTARGAVRALRRWGAGSVPATFTAALGAPRALALGHRGDVCMLGAGDDAAGGILMPDHGLFVGRGLDDEGLSAWGRELVGIGWVRVPRHLLDPARCWPVDFASPAEGGAGA